MRDIKRIIIGSSVFFSGYDDFHSKDTDVIAIMDSFLPGRNSMNMKLKETREDVFLYRNIDKEGFIQDALTSGVPMRVGKFLVPEFAEYIGLQVEELPRLKPLFEQLDEKHRYEKIIYDSYMENNSFTLTEAQRQRAYDVYKMSRTTK